MVLELIQDDRDCDLPEVRPRPPAADAGHDDRNLLLREADHRIKNSLSIVASMLRLQRRRVSDAEAVAALDDAVTRIMAVADIHRALQASETPGTVPIASTLRQLCSQLSRMRSELDLRCTADDDILMEAERAIPLSLAVNELLLNAVKYAYPPGEPGVIVLGGRQVDGGVLVTVADHGGGMPTTISSGSHFGQDMVRLFCRQLGAALDFRTAPTRGTVVTIRVPLRADNAAKVASNETSSGRGTRNRLAEG